MFTFRGQVHLLSKFGSETGPLGYVLWCCAVVVEKLRSIYFFSDWLWPYCVSGHLFVDLKSSEICIYAKSRRNQGAGVPPYFDRPVNPISIGGLQIIPTIFPPAPPLCVQMDFTRTFEANTKCNNINYVWSHFYQILVVLMYHRRLWNNIFDTDISRSINIPKKAKYAPLMWVFMHLKMSVSKILFHRRL